MLFFARKPPPATPSDLVEDRALEDIEADQLSHAPIARQVARLAAEERTPLTIGVFGPWGSGKSSLLQMVKNDLRSRDILVVHLDAWRHADLPLARQFVSTTAEQLAHQTARWELLRGWSKGRAAREAWERLYETRRVRRLRPASLRRGLGALVGTLVAIAIVVALLAWASMMLGETTGYVFTLRRIVGATLGASVVAAVVTAAVASTTMDSEQTRPGSEEELVRALNWALEEYAKNRRVVFLVDELDRCEPPEVLSTLRTMRAFLEAENSVFVVAADRDVVDQAIQRLHAAPAEPASAYYAGTGSILDKLFQIQLDVPPLRSGRLTELAVELVAEKNGVWERLGRQSTEEVVSVLIPSHVRSPRRVKVLLNAFVSAMRVAEDRHTTRPHEAADPYDKFLAVAKLVCLQTEFPSVADAVAENALVLEALILLSVADQAGEDVEESERAGIPSEPWEVAKGFVSGERRIATDIVGTDTAATEGPESERAEASLRTATTRRTELIRYLYSTSGVENPTRDLIYGTSVGARYGLAPAVADQLEMEAVDGQDRRAAELVAALPGEAEKIASIRLLCELVRSTSAFHSRHAFGALLRTAAKIEDVDLSEIGEELAEAFERVTRTEELPNRQLVGVLRLSQWFPTEAQRRHQSDLLGRGDWRQAASQVADVLRTASVWDREVQTGSRALFVEQAKADADATAEALRGLGGETLAAVWSPALWDELLATDGLVEIVAELGHADRSIVLSGVVHVAKAGEFAAATELLGSIGGAQGREEVETLVELIGEDVGDTETWGGWAAQLSPTEPGEPSASLARAVSTVLGQLELGATQAAVEELLAGFAGTRLVPAREQLELPEPDASWTQTASATSHQEALAGALRSCQAYWPEVEEFPAARRDAVERAVRSAGVITDAAVELLLGEVADLRAQGQVGPEWLSGAAEATESSSASRVPDPPSTKLVLALSAMSVEAGGGAPRPELIEEAIEHVEAGGLVLLQAWLEHAQPSTDRAVEVLRRVRGRPARQLASAVGEYVAGLTRPRATKFALAVMGASPLVATLLLKEVSPESVTQKTIAKRHAEAIAKAMNSAERRRVCRDISALRLSSPEARKIIIEALEDKMTTPNQLAATEFARGVPGWLFEAPRGVTLLRRMKQLEKTSNAKKLLLSLLGQG